MPSRSKTLLTTLWVAFVLGCKDESEPTPTPAPRATDPEIHRIALERVRPAATAIFEHLDPLAAAQRGAAELRPPPLVPIALANTGGSRGDLIVELEEIRDASFPPQLVAERRGWLRGLKRAAEWSLGRTATRTDFGVAIHNVSRVLDELELRRAIGDASPNPGAVLEACVAALAAAHGDLGAASTATLDAARADFEDVSQRLLHLARLFEFEFDDAQRKKLEAIRASLATTLLGDEVSSRWPDAALGKPQLAMLPVSLGAKSLSRLLELEEALDRNPVEAIPQLLHVRQGLEVLDQKYPRLLEIAGSDAASTKPITEARCAAAQTLLIDRLGTLGVPSQVAEGLDCAFLAQAWSVHPKSDGALLLLLLDRLYIDLPARDARRSAPAWIGLQSGRAVPASHRAIKSLALALRLQQNTPFPQGGDRADDTIRTPEMLALLAAARVRFESRLCAAVTAVWVHAEIEDRARLESWLASDCQSQPPTAWIDDAIARPRQALEGLGLSLTASGPAGAAMLEFAPWAPLGLVPPYADPDRSSPPPPKLEPIELERFLVDE